MGLFGLGRKKFTITEADKAWVEESFEVLLEDYGYPNGQDQVLISEEYFPETFKANVVKIENIIADLSVIFDIDKRVSYEFQKDIRDTEGVPYELSANPFDTALIGKEEYKIFIAESLLKRPKRLIYHMICEYLKIFVCETTSDFSIGQDLNVFIYPLATHLGLGVIMAQNLEDIGQEFKGMFRHRWSNISVMPIEVMAYILAIYTRLNGEKSAEWSKFLPKDIETQLFRALEYLDETPSDVIDENKISVQKLLNSSYEYSLKFDFEEAIEELNKTIFLTDDKIILSEVNNNIGYNLIRLKEYEQCMPYFEKSIKQDPNFAYPYSNIAYALTLKGDLDRVLYYLDKAIDLGTHDQEAYIYLFMAIYHEAMGDSKLALRNFKLAFEYEQDPVDLLDFYYGKFMVAQGENEIGTQFLQIAKDKGEPEAIEFLDNHIV